MFRKRIIALLSLALMTCFWGCENTDNSIMESGSLTPQSLSQASLETNGQLSPFKITFDGRVEDNESTTFTWTLHNPGVGPGTRELFIQLPECTPAPLSFSPENGVIIESVTDPIGGCVRWKLTSDTDHLGARQYSITLPGSVPLGEIYSSLTTDNLTEISVVPGPCQGFEITGFVFMDANSDGLINPEEESGIPNVLIELIDHRGNIQTMVTDQFGRYIFRKLEGSFTVNLDIVGQPDFFNPQLAESFEATTTLSREVTVPPGSPDINFGFNTVYKSVAVDIFNGSLPTDGQTLRYWREEFRKELFDTVESRPYEGKTLLEMLEEINDLFLKTTYSFTPGQEMVEAYNILNIDESNPYDLLIAQLLATELNHTIGRGLVDQDELQLVLISWGEALLNQEQTNPEAGIILVNPDQIANATRLFGSINTGGGGGIDE